MGLIRGVARTAVIAGTATAVSNRVSRRQYNRWAEPDQAQYVEAQPAPAPAPAGGADQDPMDQLQDLARLHTDGVLSDEEFAAAKAKILGI
jgi:hypothetical protein